MYDISDVRDFWCSCRDELVVVVAVKVTSVVAFAVCVTGVGCLGEEQVQCVLLWPSSLLLLHFGISLWTTTAIDSVIDSQPSSVILTVSPSLRNRRRRHNIYTHVTVSAWLTVSAEFSSWNELSPQFIMTAEEFPVSRADNWNSADCHSFAV